MNVYILTQFAEDSKDFFIQGAFKNIKSAIQRIVDIRNGFQKETDEGCITFKEVKKEMLDDTYIDGNDIFRIKKVKVE